MVRGKEEAMKRATLRVVAVADDSIPTTEEEQNVIFVFVAAMT